MKSTLRSRWNESLRIIWAIAAKDIVDAIKNKTTISVILGIGMMMLAGIVVNNGIILVDHINLLRKTNKNLYRVLIRVSQERLRPVLMTSVTTVIALIPMAFDVSEGSNLWRPLAITVIGGLVVATPLTLLMTSNIYLIFEQIKGFVLRRFGKLVPGSM